MPQTALYRILPMNVLRKSANRLSMVSGSRGGSVGSGVPISAANAASSIGFAPFIFSLISSVYGGAILSPSVTVSGAVKRISSLDAPTSTVYSPFSSAQPFAARCQ